MFVTQKQTILHNNCLFHRQVTGATNLAKFVSRLQDERFEMVYSISTQKLQDTSPEDLSTPENSSFNRNIVAIKENVTRRFDKTDISLNNLKEWRDIEGHKL